MRGAEFHKNTRRDGPTRILRIFKKWQRKVCFASIDSSAEEGPALPIAMCRENLREIANENGKKCAKIGTSVYLVSFVFTQGSIIENIL